MRQGHIKSGGIDRALSNIKFSEVLPVTFSLLLFLDKRKKLKNSEFVETAEYEKGFTEYYKEHLLPLAEEFEKSRIKALNKSRLLLYFLFIPYIIFIEWPVIFKINLKESHFSFSFNSSTIDDSFFIYFILMFVILSICLHPLSKYNRAIKDEIFPKIISFIGNYKYSCHCPDRVHLFKDYEIVPNYDIERSEDLFQGSYKDVDIELFETLLEQEREDSKKNRTFHQVFQGLFITLNIHKNFNGKTIIVKDRGSVGNWFSKLQYKKFGAQHADKSLSRVELEDPVFEKLFEIFSTDQIEARYLLTTSFMDRFIKLYEHFGKKDIQASFYKEKMLITIPCKENMFEPASILEPEDFINDAKKLLKEMSIIFSIIDTLKLDMNIGM